MKEVSVWLGHADIWTIINIYYYVDIENKKAIADKLNKNLDIYNG